MTGGLLRIALLTGIYAVALGSTEAADLATGAVLGTGVLAVTGQLRGSGERGLVGRLVAFPGWALVVAREVTTGTWQVAVVSLGLRRPPRAGIVAIPIGERTPEGVAVSALAATLSPGELLIDVDWDERLLFLHVMDASDPDAVRRRHQEIYDRHQRRVFP